MEYICLVSIKVLRFLRSKFYQAMDLIYYYGMPGFFKKCGQNIHIHYPCNVIGLKNIEIGHNVHINRNAFISGSGGLKIKDNVHIARDLIIYTKNHNYRGKALPYDSTNIEEEVIIEKNVWIGIRVTILPGVRIGEGAIIGAGSVISKDVPPLAVVGSSKQRVLMSRDKKHYEELETQGIYGGRDGRILKNNI